MSCMGIKSLLKIEVTAPKKGQLSASPSFPNTGKWLLGNVIFHSFSWCFLCYQLRCGMSPIAVTLPCKHKPCQVFFFLQEVLLGHGMVWTCSADRWDRINFHFPCRLTDRKEVMTNRKAYRGTKEFKVTGQGGKSNVSQARGTSVT